MIVGNYLGKHVGTNLGGAAGAAGGYLYASNMKANLNLAKGAQVQLQLNHSVVPAMRQAGR
jgi:outer membrane lipoprotein SlyB